MTLTYRDALPSDASNILDYLNLAGQETANLSFGEEGIGIRIEDETTYLEKIQGDLNEFMILALDQDQIIGIANVTRGKRLRTQHVATLGISLLKSHWNQGIGNALMKQIMDRARVSPGLEIIRLDVRQDNQIAVRLYQKYGFEKIGCFNEEMKIDDVYVAIETMRCILNK